MFMKPAITGRRVVGLGVATVITVAGLGVARWPARAQGKAASSTVATVGSASIGRDEFQQRAAAGIAEVERRRGTQLTPELRSMVSRQALESLIRSHLLVLEAQRTGIPVSDAEAEALVKRDPIFTTGGVYDEQRYQALKQSNPQGYQEALRQAKRELSGRKLSERLQKRMMPEEAELRASASRALTRARVQALALRPEEFSGDYPEPREQEVVDYYHANARDLMRPARVELSVLRLDRAALPASASRSERGQVDATLRARADSVLDVIRAGPSLESVAEGLGLRVVGGQVVLQDNFPGAWRGTDRINAAVFKTAPGVVLTEPVPTTDGYWIVRIDHSEPAGVTPLRVAAPLIRRQLREERRLHHEDRVLAALYAAQSAEFKTTAFRVRYAVLDTGTIAVPEPSSAELDRWYRGHQADYTSYDAATASIRVTPLQDVEDDVRRRWKREQRARVAQDLAENLQQAWSRDRRDKALERKVTSLHDVGPLPEGAMVDTGAAGAALTDSLESRGAVRGAAVIRYSRGLVVYHVYALVPDYLPTFEQVRPAMAERRRVEREQEIERQAREQYERDPKSFAEYQVLHFTRVLFEPPSIVDIPLTRREIERYHREHIDRYSAPELVRARHILVSPSSPGPEGVAAARRRAEALLERVRAGEDFERLARENSDDPPTRESGGDLGSFGRGAMLEPVERAAFGQKPGQVSDVIETEVGFHIVKTIDYQPLAADPLVYVYTNVGADAAMEKGMRIARQRADSILSLSRNPQAAMATALRTGSAILSMTHTIGNLTSYPEAARASMARLEKVPIGQLHPSVVEVRGSGYAIQWPDSITRGRGLPWPQVRERVILQFKSEAGKRGVAAKRAEIDSLLASGWSFDSVAVLWGAPEQGPEVKPGAGIPGLAPPMVVDSLLFSDRALAPGATSAWIDRTEVVFMLKLVERLAPHPNEVANRVEMERRMAFERGMYEYYEGLKRRYPVRILDPEMRDVALPAPPEPKSS